MEAIRKEVYVKLKLTFDRLVNGANAIDQNSAAIRSWNMVMRPNDDGDSEVFISNYEQVQLQLVLAAEAGITG